MRDLEDALPDTSRLDTEVLLDPPAVSGTVRVGKDNVSCFVDRAGAVYLRCAQDVLVHYGVTLAEGTHLRAVEITPMRLANVPWLRVGLEVA